MSGGVDSSVATTILKNQGYDVAGVHLKISAVCDEKDEYDARRVCGILKIPFYVIDISDEYQKTVAADMIQGYAKGITPNPDVLCNQSIKFGFVFDKLQKMDFDPLRPQSEASYIATGHYARINSELRIQNSESKLKNIYKLYTAEDKDKDQTYFLWGIRKSRLSKILFPIGDYFKKDVRKLAKKFGLPNSEKKDSQGICFLGKITFSDYLREFLKEKKGKIVDSKGNILGEHNGHWFFTEGQRHGLDIKTCKGPYFVAKKDSKKNLIIVAKANEKILYKKQVKLKNLNWLIEKPKNKIRIFLRCRYRQSLVKAIFDPNENLLVFSKPQKAIASGQSAVFYLPVKNKTKNDKKTISDFLMLGGGIIK